MQAVRLNILAHLPLAPGKDCPQGDRCRLRPAASWSLVGLGLSETGVCPAGFPLGGFLSPVLTCGMAALPCQQGAAFLQALRAAHLSRAPGVSKCFSLN